MIENRENERPLESWKEIAAYLQRDPKTARRWEKHESLPVHRHRHRAGSTVYAYPSELDVWLANREVETAQSPDRKWLWRRPVPAVASAIALALALLTVGGAPNLGTMEARAAGASGMVIRCVWEGPDVDGMGKPSPDGRRLTFVDWDGGGNLALRDLVTGETRILRNTGPWSDSVGFAESSIWSPDGKRIAYALYTKEEIEEIRVIGLDASEPQVVYRNSENNANPAAWFPDGKSILAVLSAKDRIHQIARISVADGSALVLKRFEWIRSRPGAVSLSPDAQYIAYDFPSAENSPQRDIYVLAADGSRESPLIAHPANDRLLGWAPDGSILFLSDRTGEHDVWRVEINDGKQAERPALLKRDTGIIDPVGFTASGSFFYTTPSGMHDVYVATFDLVAGKLLSPPARATESFVGSTTRPDWSPEGESLAYVVHKGPLHRQLIDNKIRVRSMSTGSEVELAASFRRIGSPRWSPDGRSLLICGARNEVTRGCHLLDVGSGEVTTIVEAPDKNDNVAIAVWSPDGSAIFYSVRTHAGREWTGRIVRREIDTGRETVLHSMPYFHNPAYLDVSPDGRQLAYTLTHTTVDGERQPGFLMTISTAGGEPREIARVELPQYIIPDSLMWTRDERSVLFGKWGENIEGMEFWRVSRDGGEPEKLMGLDMKEQELRNFRLHPDGRRIAFHAGQGGGEIWVMENFLPEPNQEQQR
jgi:Tol biopolymer transport system component